ncbi:MAG: hypothetical protein H0V49_07400 [Nocardioidaceae bacterium]|nr:hypothetical protein [Nocardioidaceae bacterium]
MAHRGEGGAGSLVSVLLHLVRHGLPVQDAEVEPALWARHDNAHIEISRLKRSGVLPSDAAAVEAVVRALLRANPTDIVMIGHGTAWTLLVAEPTGKSTGRRGLIAPDGA